MADARMVARLADSPEWAELRTIFDDAKETYFRKLARRIYSNPESITNSDLHYKRGVYRGVEIVLNEPHRLAEALQKAADRTETNV